MSNASILKADMAIADLAANGGELQPMEGSTFIRTLIKTPTILPQVRVVEMTGSKMNIDKIVFGARILRKATSATALTQSQRAKPTTSQVQLSTKEQIAEVWLPYDVVENAIENAAAANNEPSNSGPGGIRQTVIELMAQRAASDLEELALLADTDYTNGADSDDQDFLSQFDGFLKIGASEGNVVDVANATASKTMFKKSLKELPVQYLRNRGDMRFFVSPGNEIEYRDTLSNRATGLGDQYTTGDLPSTYASIPVVPVQYMPSDRGLFTDPKNLILGVQRRISMEYDKDISARVYKIVLTLRVDVQVEESDAIVYIENIADNAD